MTTSIPALSLEELLQLIDSDTPVTIRYRAGGNGPMSVDVFAADQPIDIWSDPQAVKIHNLLFDLLTLDLPGGSREALFGEGELHADTDAYWLTHRGEYQILDPSETPPKVLKSTPITETLRVRRKS